MALRKKEGIGEDETIPLLSLSVITVVTDKKPRALKKTAGFLRWFSSVMLNANKAVHLCEVGGYTKTLCYSVSIAQLNLIWTSLVTLDTFHCFRQIVY